MKGQVRQLVESLTKDAGNVREGQRRFGKLVADAIKEGEVSPHDFSIRELFDVLVDPHGEVAKEDAQAITEAINSTEFPYVTNKLISKETIDAYELAIGPTKELCTEIKMNTNPMTIVGFTDVDLPTDVPETMPYPNTEFAEKRVEVKAYKTGSIIQLTRELILFDQTGEVMDRAQQIGDKMGYLEYKTVIQRGVADLATSHGGTSADTCLKIEGSTLATYSSDHSASDPGANTNDNQTATAFGTAGLKTLVNVLMKQKDHNSEYIKVRPTYLIVPTTLGWEARELLGSKLVYDTTENTKNVFYNAFKLIVDPILDDDDTTDFYLGDFKKDIVLGRVWPMEITERRSNSEAAFYQDIIQQYKVSSFFGVNRKDYRHSAMSET